jgi:hypothetical protein
MDLIKTPFWMNCGHFRSIFQERDCAGAIFENISYRACHVRHDKPIPWVVRLNSRLKPGKLTHPALVSPNTLKIFSEKTKKFHWFRGFPDDAYCCHNPKGLRIRKK